MDCMEPTALEHLPLELLDMVLMKAVSLNLSEWLKAEPANNYLIPWVITPLRRVCILWDGRLTTRWFKIVLKRRLKNGIVNLHLLHELSSVASCLSYGLTTLDDSVCVLNCDPKMVRLYEVKDPYHHLVDIRIEEIESPHSMISCRKSQSLYVTDKGKHCVWKIAKDSLHVVLWLSNFQHPFMLSVSTDENHILALKDSQDSSTIDIYTLGAVLVRSIPLPSDFQMPQHAVQNGDDNFIVSHWKKMTNRKGIWVVSQLDGNGRLIRQFNPKHKLQELQYPRYLSMDLSRDRLFVADYGKSRVILFSYKSLRWKQILLTKEDDEIWLPRLHYDDVNELLVIAKMNGDIRIYKVDSKSF